MIFMFEFLNDMAYVGFMVEEEKRKIIRDAVDAMYAIQEEFDANFLEEYFYEEGIDLDDSDLFYLFDCIEKGE